MILPSNRPENQPATWALTYWRGTGRYENASEVVRAALRTLEREEQQYELKLTALRAAVDEGDASGIAEGNVFARLREKLDLATPPR